MRSQAPSTWRESSPGIYSRPLDEPDLYYTTNAKVWERTGQTADTTVLLWHPVSSVTLKPSSGIGYLRWPMTIDKWLDETFTVKCGSQTAKEFLDFDPPVPFSALFVFSDPGTKQSKLGTIKYNIVLRCGHDVIDSMAAYAFLEKLLGFTAEAFKSKENIPDVIFGNEYRNLPPPFRAVLAKNGYSIPGKTRFSTLTFSANVTQAIHAAIALAVRDLQPCGDVERQGKYVSYAIMSLRKFCQEPYNGPEYTMMTCYANSTCLMVVDVTIPSFLTTVNRQSPKEFAIVLEKVRTFYQEEAIPKDMLEAALCLAARTPVYPSSSSPMPTPSQSASVSLSSRGITDHYVKSRYGQFEVLDPWCMGTELSNALEVALNTWKGETCLQAGYNAVFQEHRDVDLFLESVKRIVLQGLEID
ncbi:hypothetical protein DL98DRAFT_623189 [Cadophora sp. DSE1049]|nr:hypothetical protein DL98DRAFT_623189 [Cadophora sp. DSE1049]